MEKQYKVLMLCIPLTGHFNPFLGFASELARRQNVKAIMYTNKECRSAIEQTNIEFRNLEIVNFSHQLDVMELRHNMPVDKILYFQMDAANAGLDELVRCVDEEGIDLIIYDFMTVYGKWLVKYLRIKHARGELRRPPPKAMMFGPSIQHQQGVYPNSHEKQFLPKNAASLSFLLRMLVFFVKYSYFCYKHRLPIENPEHLIFYTKENFNVCCIMPEFHPRAHLYPPTIKFVGNCASESLRAETVLSEPLKSFLEPYPAVNPLPLENLRVKEPEQRSLKRLVYVSLGTIVNTHIQSYLTIVEAIKLINESTAKDPKSPRYDFLISVGQVSYDKFQAMMKNKEIEMPDNVLIQAKVPQLDVLKRTSLFITHSGQGSTSEAVHYGVPMVCIPVMGDQAAVAYRTTDELGLGVRLNFDDLQPSHIKTAVLGVLGDKSYLERSLLFAQLSRKYNGTKEATQLTIEYLQTSNDALKKQN